jgi:hypothetical protein
VLRSVCFKQSPRHVLRPHEPVALGDPVVSELIVERTATDAGEPDGTSVKVQGTGYMYEGGSCKTDDLATQASWDPFVAAAGSTWNMNMSLYNSEAGSWDSSDIKLVLTNVTAP